MNTRPLLGQFHRELILYLTSSCCYLLISLFAEIQEINPLPHMPILDSPNSAANKHDIKNIDKWGYNFLID